MSYIYSWIEQSFKQEKFCGLAFLNMIYILNIFGYRLWRNALRLHTQFPSLISVVRCLSSVRGGQSCLPQVPPSGVFHVAEAQLRAEYVQHRITMCQTGDVQSYCGYESELPAEGHCQAENNELYWKKNGVHKSYTLLSLTFFPLRKRNHYNFRTKPKDDRSC